MRILPRRFRRLVPLSIALGVIVAIALEVATAGASPATSPPIAPQSPGDGANVPASSEGLQVTFTCPSFPSPQTRGHYGEKNKEGEEGEEGEKGQSEEVSRQLGR